MLSAIVSTFNEERHIAQCLRSLFEQRDAGPFEVIVVDGESDDATIEIVRSFPEYGSRLRLLPNPQRLAVFAWNRGAAAARGEYLAFISAHAGYDPAHFRTCLDILRRGEADAVGPVQVAVGTSRLGNAVAWAMRTPFGIGNARFRFARRQETVDTVFSMVLARATFERVGGYDERLAFDEDSEFAYRLRAAGGRIVVSPAIAARYHVRDSLPALARQMFRYGYWRRFTRALHPHRVPLRVYAPPALVGALLASIACAAVGWYSIAAAVPLAYASYVAAAMLAALPQLGVRCTTWLPAVLPCMHLAYGAGFWRALFSPRLGVVDSSAPRRRAGRSAAH